MSLQQKLLNILMDGASYSGEELASQCGVTRAAVWKAIKKLQSELELRIDAVRGKGYRLFNKVELLDKNKIISQLSEQHKNSQLDVLFEVDSTNNYLLQNQQEHSEAQIVLSESQSAGRGRRGRQWVSPFASSLYLSVKWRFRQTPAALMGLSLAVAVSIVRALKSFSFSDLELKWPNDILYKGQKLCGILIELRSEVGSDCSVVVGVGINIHSHERLQKEVEQRWVCLDTMTDKVPERNQLAAGVLNELLNALAEFEEQGMASFTKEWLAHDKYLNQTVVLHFDDRTVEGVSRGIDEQGAILIEEAGQTKQLQRYFSGEVSLRSAI